MLTADLRREPTSAPTSAASTTNISPKSRAICGELEAEALTWLRSTGMSSDDVLYERAADMRYAGQEHAVTVNLEMPFTAGDAQPRIKSLFDAAHLQMFSHNAPEEDAEIVSLRVSIVGRLPKPHWIELPKGSPTPPASALTGRRPVRFGKGSPVDAAVYDRSALLAGNVIEGPAIVQELASSTTIPPRTRCEVSAFGHLLLTAAE